MEIHFKLNGSDQNFGVSERLTLLQLLRDKGCYSVKHGCESGDCGACTVLVNDRPAVSCIMLAVQAHEKRVTTLEGLDDEPIAACVQDAFVNSGAIQCGYCTPAMVLVARALLGRSPSPSETEIREALTGVLCRCTGYVKPVEAVLHAARRKTELAKHG
jgi:putative selenate reductase molybdopterin-binding subunit